MNNNIINPSQVPYLEKHRIFELFHELGRELIIQQPDDHVEFLKNILINARKATETSRVVILASPRINVHRLGNAIVAHTKQIIITPNEIAANMQELPPELKIEYIQNLLRQSKVYESGWILIDCIQTRQDAEILIKRGILPTHVLHLIAPHEPPLDRLLYCNVPRYWPDYRRQVSQIRDVFKKVLREIPLLNRRSGEVINECIKVISLKTSICAIKPRILILGPRGSGRRTQAKLLVEKLNIIHVDFEQLFHQLRQSRGELGKKLQTYNSPTDLDTETSIEIINKNILEEDCLFYGWVMTGFPSTELDFKHLDSLDTPPNRAIFLECDLAICKERLQTEWESIESIEEQLLFYCENYGNLRKYCENTAHYIDANQHQRCIHENIMATIANQSNPAPPRSGIDKEIVEKSKVQR